jgi:hypothetical protein
MTIEELKDIVTQGLVFRFDPERRYILVLNRDSVPHATTSQLAMQIKRLGVKGIVLLADFQEGREPPLQVFEVRPDVQ